MLMKTGNNKSNEMRFTDSALPCWLSLISFDEYKGLKILYVMTPFQKGLPFESRIPFKAAKLTFHYTRLMNAPYINHCLHKKKTDERI